MISSRVSSQLDICGLQLMKNNENPQKLRVFYTSNMTNFDYFITGASAKNSVKGMNCFPNIVTIYQY